MDAAVRRRSVELTPEMVPSDAGVYAWYRNGERMYVGTAASLRTRLWGNHLGQSQGLTASALRRNVAEHLGFGEAAAIKRREISLTGDQLAAVRAWILSCEVAWLTCLCDVDALELETGLKAEYMPPLTKR